MSHPKKGVNKMLRHRSILGSRQSEVVGRSARQTVVAVQHRDLEKRLEAKDAEMTQLVV